MDYGSIDSTVNNVFIFDRKNTSKYAKFRYFNKARQRGSHNILVNTSIVSMFLVQICLRSLLISSVQMSIRGWMGTGKISS